MQPYFFGGKFFQAGTQRFGRTLDVSLDDNLEFLYGALTDCIVKIIKGNFLYVLGVFKTFQLLPFYRYAAGCFFIIDNLQGISRVGNAFKTQYLDGH